LSFTKTYTVQEILKQKKSSSIIPNLSKNLILKGKKKKFLIKRYIFKLIIKGINYENINILTWDVIEIAKQLTIIDEYYYLNIDVNGMNKNKKKECFHIDKKVREEKAPSIDIIIKRSDVISKWINFEILTKFDFTSRLKALKKIIKLCGVNPN
jgi:hypothetical protein